jgi:hypothetical protein
MFAQVSTRGNASARLKARAREIAPAQTCKGCANRGDSIKCPNVGCEGGGTQAWCRSFIRIKAA